MPSRIDEAGHTKAFDYPVAEHWGESQRTKRSLVGQSEDKTVANNYYMNIVKLDDNHLMVPDHIKQYNNSMHTGTNSELA